MKRLSLLLLVFLNACGAHAGPFRMAPAEPVQLSPGVEPVFYVVPMQDRRHQKQVWKGRSRYEDVSVEAEGLTLSSQAWQEPEYGSVALLWHRQLGEALAGAGYAAAASDEPLSDDRALHQAGEAGAKYLLSGRLELAQIDQRGADTFFGTNFSGTNYKMALRVRLKAVEVSSGKTALDLPWDYKRVFYDPTLLGSPDYQTFPSYFLVGLKDAAGLFAGQADLRGLAGLPPLTPTPSVTPTPMTTPPTPGPSPTPLPTAVPSATPEPDLKPYWVNPKTGKTVDPSWNFDPEDGTPRKDFVLRQPAPKPTPVRQRAPR